MVSQTSQVVGARAAQAAQVRLAAGAVRAGTFHLLYLKYRVVKHTATLGKIQACVAASTAAPREATQVRLAAGTVRLWGFCQLQPQGI